MSPRIVSGMSRALFDSDLIATRLCLFLGELCWAVMLFWPGDTFGRPTYSLMSEVAGEPWWATAFAISAFLQIRIVALDLCRTRWAEWFAVWNACLWVCGIGLMLASVYPPPAAIGGEIALMVSAVWIAVRPHIIARGERHACLL
jgi:hypothetical protein